MGVLLQKFWQLLYPRRPCTPWVSLAVATVCIVICVAPAPVAAALVYERDAWRTHEYYRLLTFPLVHFGFYHLFYNMLGLAAFALLYEARDTKEWSATFRIACLFAVAFFAQAAWMALRLENMTYAGGLSGVLEALLFVSVVDIALEMRTWTPFLLLAIYVARIVFHHSFHMNFADPGLAVDYSAHVVGLATGVVWVVIEAFLRHLSLCGRVTFAHRLYIDSVLFMRSKRI